ncbi:MAG: hypothetical protein SPE11_12200 [Parabacteroides sp.]|nr:hypothetical protein [Parabacteroides distasonis]MCI6875102.1 hypothetical protein [Parabacteroides sp.]MDD6100674.1 hypothetical protein [bacterium]MDD6748448.1 hypothetical protein [bacterium]MDD6835794.1 hypothetical protein [bacterium]
MNTKIQELTDKIYREGVEKGNEEAGRIIAEAQSQKQSMISEAEAEAKRIIAEAEKQASELKKNTEAELKLFAAQSVEALKSEVANLITGDVVSANVKAAMADKAFMQQVILTLAKSWASQEALTIQSSEADALARYFESNAKALLNQGVKIEKVAGKSTSFTILPADGSYKVTFGEEEFVAFFKDFLRPQLVEMLF